MPCRLAPDSLRRKPLSKFLWRKPVAKGLQGADKLRDECGPQKHPNLPLSQCVAFKIESLMFFKKRNRCRSKTPSMNATFPIQVFDLEPVGH